MQYRPDIEGIRALAILLVVAAHAGIPGFRGGFIGVDLFFVISGFLITGLLVRERLNSGTIDFAMFYAKRLRRLLPALLAMLGSTALLGWQLLPSSLQQAQAVAGLAASLWLSNLHFAIDQVGYFEPGSETNLYLHTWSLGVEEQFYLVWPCLVVLTLMRVSDLDRTCGRLKTVLSGLALTSLVGGIWVTLHWANYAFYLMPTRAWQFAVGGLVYLFARPSGGADRSGLVNARYAPVLGIAGLGLIGCGLVYMDDGVPYPGVWAALPTIGAALLVAAGCFGVNPVTCILSVRPLKYLGSVSYSWYLWHWPVLLLGSALVTVAGLEYRCLLVAASLLLAIASYQWVESPLRRKACFVLRPTWTIVGAMVAMLAAAFGYVAWAGYAQHHRQVAVADMREKYHVSLPVIYEMGCDDWYHSAEVRICQFGSAEAKKTAVLIGDSIGVQWFPAMERIFAARNWRLLVLTKSSCPMVDRPYFYARIGREFSECAEWRQHSLDLVSKLAPNMVVLGSTHTAGFSKEDWIEGTRSVLSRIAPHVGKVFILRSTPHLPFDGAQCLEERGVLYQWVVPSDRSCAAPADVLASSRVAGWVADAASSIPNVRFIDMDDWVCPNGVCHAALNGVLVYRDRQHLNADFVVNLAGPLSASLGLSLSAAADE